MGDQQAMRIHGANKTYGNGKGCVPVLRGLDMTVPRGRIYGLLGPSGCGKTTLLKCMLGKLRLDSGQVLVFGKKPGNRKTGVPGSRVGYMPQELALFAEFSIGETLEYFSRLHGMTREDFQDRMTFLLKFLDLPRTSRSLDTMSGGQQRRASLAVALLHRPELLILDEPTVGVDPLLRQGIWEHLVELAGSSPPTTVVVTTHYTEEALQAHTVGMMRGGRLLAEGSPQELLARHEKISLEDVFLELCLGDQAETHTHSDSREDQGKVRQVTDQELGVTDNLLVVDKDREGGKVDKWRGCCHREEQEFSPRIVMACMGKTFNRMRKRWGFLIYTFILPALQVSLFCMAVGQDPRDLEIAVWNEEIDGNSEECPYSELCPVDRGFMGVGMGPNDHMANLSCRFYSFLESSVIKPVLVSTEEEAMARVQSGQSWGVLRMDQNFSMGLYNKVFNSLSCTDPLECSALNQGHIRVRLDVTNQQIALTLQLKLVEAFLAFMEQVIESCSLPLDMASLPIVFDKPVYGSEELTFTDFMVPGIILTIVHSMALAFSAMLIIIERNEGLVERTWVAGVNPSEASLAHFLSSCVINLVQVLLTLGFMLIAFQMRVEGSYLLLFLLTLLQGVAGTTIGLVISAVCRTQQDATQIALGIFYPNMILSGILWPLEAMPSILRYIAYLLPQTLACEAMRSILMRGWGLEHIVVARGFLVTILWTLGTYLLFKLKIHKSH